MAEKKETKKTAPKRRNTAKKSTEIVDSASQMVPDEVGLEAKVAEDKTDEVLAENPELVEKIEEIKEKIKIDHTTGVIEIPQFRPDYTIPSVSEPNFNDSGDVMFGDPADYIEENPAENEEPEGKFTEDPEMVNDITNILNGLDGVKANKLDGDEQPKVEKAEEKKEQVSPKNMTNTEEKNYYSEQFSRSWGGVMYDY